MRIDWNCQLCGKDTSENEKDYYMLDHSLWNQIAPNPNGMLCIDCVEITLGRQLEKEDLLDCPVNENNPYISQILGE